MASSALARRGPLEAVANFSSFVRVSHTLFSLPLVVAGLLLGARGIPSARVAILGLLAAIGARIAGMALNRIIDRRIDAENPRTKGRELPRGAMSLTEARLVVVAGVLLYLISAALLGPWTAILSPIPLLVFWGYPYLKRLTRWCHAGVGLALGLAPLGGWMAVSQSFEGFERVLPLGVFAWAWVTGFDIIYATLDMDFDRRAGVHSLPAAFGRDGALRVSAALHIVAFGCLLWLQAVQGWGTAALPFLGVAGVLLWLEQRLSSRVELAFFRINIGVGFAVLGQVVAGLLGG